MGHGALVMRAKADSPGQSSPLTVMARDANYLVQVVATANPGSSAAIGLFYSPNHWLFSEISSSGIRVYGDKQTLASSPWQGNTAHLRIVNRHNQVEFLASEDGHTWKSLAANVDTSGYITSSLGGFEALRPALAASGSGEAHFTQFTYRAL